MTQEAGLDRLRRWYRDVRGRDLLTGPVTRDAATDLKPAGSASMTTPSTSTPISAPSPATDSTLPLCAQLGHP